MITHDKFQEAMETVRAYKIQLDREIIKNCGVEPFGFIRNKILGRYRLGWDDITSKKRNYHLAECRHLLMFMAYGQKYTLVDIGKMFKRDHSTVLHGIRRVNDQMDVDEHFRNLVNELLMDIKNIKN